MGRPGSALDNAAAEAVNSLYKKELINREGPWQDAGHVTVGTAVATPVDIAFAGDRAFFRSYDKA